jgi:hypothetical protein
VIAEPPVETDLFQKTTKDLLLATTLIRVGALGGAMGLAAITLELTDEPTPLVATTLTE